MATTTINELKEHSNILLYDGVCRLCDRSVQFVLRHDSKKQFLFGSLSSELASDFFGKQSTDFSQVDSVVLITKDAIYTKSSAALKVLQLLGGAWRMSGILYIIPKYIRDKVYAYIAKHRYKWFGILESCRVPTPQEANRFID